jgi:hypothetical protein
MSATAIRYRRVLSPKAVTVWTVIAVLITGLVTGSQKACAVLVTVPAALGWAAVIFLTWALPPHKPLAETRMLLAGIASAWRTLRAALALGITAVYGAGVAIAMNAYLGHHSTANSRAAGQTILDAMLEPTKYIAIALAILTPGWFVVAMYRTTPQARHDAAEKAAHILYLLPTQLLRGIMVLIQILSSNSWTIPASQKPRFPQVKTTLAHLINQYTKPRAVGWLCLMTFIALLFWTTHTPAGGIAAG